MKRKKIVSLLVVAVLGIQSMSTIGAKAVGGEAPLFAFRSYDFDTKEATYDETNPVLIHKDGPQVTIPETFSSPKEQFRTAWVSTVFNIDFPSTDALADKKITEEEFKRDYNKVLDRYDEYNMNAVTFQVSPMLDAWYKSEIAPWSQYLHDGAYTSQGKTPAFGENFDPMAWMIEETHKRGMEFHAWFNPYRVTNNVDTRSKEEKLAELADNNFARLNPNLVYEFQNKLFLDPGRPEVVQYVVDRVEEVINKYDVDAIHFDDYFYPYKYTKTLENGSTVDVVFKNENIDIDTFNNYSRGITDINKWREDNINVLIKAVSEKIDGHNKANKTSIQYGVSPFGIWGHEEDMAGGSKTPIGSTSSLRDQFADTKKWAEKGWIDYLTPQVYWAFGTAAAPYGELVKWWDEQFENINESHLYIGHPNYKYIDASWDSNFKNPEELGNQLRYNQKFSNVKGSGFFSLNKFDEQKVVSKGDKFDILNNTNMILKNDYLNEKSNVPAKPWLDKVDTKPVAFSSITKENNQIKIAWNDDNTDSKFYAVYREEGDLTEVNTNDPKNMIARFGIKNGKEFIDTTAEEGKVYTYAVTIIDNAGVENKATVFNLTEEKKISKVIDVINNLPEAKDINLEHEAMIVNARKLVGELKDSSRVTNLNKLLEAEDALAKLKEDNNKPEENNQGEDSNTETDNGNKEGTKTKSAATGDVTSIGALGMVALASGAGAVAFKKRKK
ncbi:family 10 glycosylhydrolase [Clostridium sp. LP20]|uniref:glycoside hydrolase family 10 protein n=1 Tax=Clostridium sp. LP20 TaxID=3418665 RepID=UPI003EE743B9